MKKRIFSTALFICLAMSLIFINPMTAQAADNISHTGSFTVNNTRALTTEIVFAGQRWLVIGYNGAGVASAAGDITLLAKDTIGTSIFHATSNAYATSSLKTAIDSIVTTFTAQEQAAIKPTDLTDVSVTDAMLWPLDAEEAKLVNSTIRATNYSGGSNLHWWLRSPGKYSTNIAVIVTGDGSVFTDGVYVNDSLGVRPAFILNLSSVLFASAAADGKSGIQGATLSAVSSPTGAQKLTIKDSSLSAGTVTATGQNLNAGTPLKVSVTGATPDESVSAIITDSTGQWVKYYGKIGSTDPDGDASNLDLKLPVTLDAGNVLKIFVEEINGDNLTDYASNPVTVAINGVDSDTTPTSNVTTADIIVLGTAEEVIAPVYVRSHDLTCYQVWVNEDNQFEFIFWWEYKNNNWVKIYNMAGGEVFSIDMKYGDAKFIADLPNGMYTVKTFHEEGKILQEFIIGKP